MAHHFWATNVDDSQASRPEPFKYSGFTDFYRVGAKHCRRHILPPPGKLPVFLRNVACFAKNRHEMTFS